jgi:aryl-phospho-beta-D-glucosidase BglC (GH1 family)
MECTILIKGGMMRKIILLFCILLLLFVSCSDDNSGNGGGGNNEGGGGNGGGGGGGGNSETTFPPCLGCSQAYTGTAMDFVSSIKIGWNLGNTFDAHQNLMPNETVWQSTVTTQAFINKVKDDGFGAVRIPVTWGRKLHQQLSNSPGNISLSAAEIEALTIDAVWLNRVAEVVEYVRSAGMKAIINIHHDGADSAHWLSVRSADLTGNNKAKVDAIFKTIWKQIAVKFKDHGDFLIFEGFNELHDGGWGYPGTRYVHGVSVTTTAQDLINQRIRVNELNQIFVNTVRAVGGENSHRFLMVHGLVTRPSETWANHFTLPTDTVQDRMIAGIHFYDPYDFSGSASWNTWGQAVNTGNRNWANENNVTNQFNNIKTRFIDNNIPVILGEYGAVRQTTAKGNEYRRYYIEYVTKAAIDRGIMPFYWDNGSNPNGTGGAEQFGLYNRSTRTHANDAAAVIQVIMKAAKENYNISEIIAPIP